MYVRGKPLLNILKRKPPKKIKRKTFVKKERKTSVRRRWHLVWSSNEFVHDRLLWIIG
jgi:hypothetical protein